MLAHPRLVNSPCLRDHVSRLRNEGLEGIEAYYPKHTDENVAEYLALADEFGLFVTEGSDYHGGMRTGTAIGKEARGGERLFADVGALFARFGA